MRNLRLDICYDGTRYKGWQRLPGTENTVQGKLEQCLSRILGESIEVTGSGRTDAGVHAQGQVVNFHCESELDEQALLEALRQLPERERMFIYYKYFENITNREIARRMSMNENTVSAIMARARNKLRNILEDSL